MWRACKNDKGKDAEKALKSGCPVDFQDEDWGHSALHRAAAFNALSVIRVLRAAGAPLDLKNVAKETPLETAKKLDNELAAKLLEAFADGKTGDGIGQDEEDDGSDTEDAGVAADGAGADEAAADVTANGAKAEPPKAEPPTAAMNAVAIE